MRDGLQDGIAILEAALMSGFLCILVLCAVGVTDYLDHLQFIHALVERELNDSAVKPFKLEIEEGSSAAMLLRLNNVKLRPYVIGLVNATHQAAQERDYRKVFVEARYAKANIDSQTGVFLGFDETESFSHQVGPQSISEPALAFSDLIRRFEELASKTHSSGNLAGSSLITVPAAGYGENTAEVYVNGSVLVGLRVIASLEGTLAGASHRHLGIDPVVESYKVVQLRGVIE